MRIALVLLPAWSVDTAPLGISCVAAAAREAGHDVDVIDANVGLWHTSAWDGDVDPWDYGSYQQWEREDLFVQQVLPWLHDGLQQVADGLVAGAYEAVGFSVFGTSRHSSLYVAERVRAAAPQVKLLFGGPATRSYAFDEALYAGTFDAAVTGEGERTAEEVFRTWEAGGSVVGLPGTITEDDAGQLVRGEERPHAEIDQLSAPAFDDYDLDLYRLRALPLSMSRGCVASCVFCTELCFWKPYRARSPELVLAEVRRGVERHGIQRFEIADSLLNGHHGKLESLLDRIVAEGLDLQFAGYFRFDRRLTRELLEKLAVAGCTRMSFGLESGSQRVLDRMNKGTTVEQASRVLRAVRDVGLAAYVDIIAGFPGETDEDVQQTLDFLAAHADCIHTVNTGESMGIGPGMALWDDLRGYGVQQDEHGYIALGPDGGWVSLDGTSTWTSRRETLARVRRFLQAAGIDFTPRG